MLCLGTWTSELSVHLLFTINMVESKDAYNSRHSRRAVSRAEDESSSGKSVRSRNWFFEV